MSDVELLFAVLAAIYWWECGCWLPRGIVAFRNIAGGKWWIAFPGAWIGNQRGGFVLTFPFPPLGRFVTAAQFPVSFSEDSALAYVAASTNPGVAPLQTGVLSKVDEIKSIRAKGKKLLINDTLFVRSPSHTAAITLAQQLEKWRALPRSTRAAIRELIFRSAFDLNAARKRWNEFELQSRPLFLLTNGLFVYLFIFAPILIWKMGIVDCWLGLLLGLPAFTIPAAIYFRKAHKAFFPVAEEDRFTHFVTVLLSPVTTIRAQDLVTRSLLEDFHPITVARLFCSQEDFERYARQLLIEVRYPGPGSRLEGLALKTETDSRAILLAEMERFLKAERVDIKKLTKAPEPSDKSSLSYCPRCEAQFSTPSGVCVDCGNLALVPFKPAS